MCLNERFVYIFVGASHADEQCSSLQFVIHLRSINHLNYNLIYCKQETATNQINVKAVVLIFVLFCGGVLKFDVFSFNQLQEKHFVLLFEKTAL